MDRDPKAIVKTCPRIEAGMRLGPEAIGLAFSRYLRVQFFGGQRTYLKLFLKVISLLNAGNYLKS